MVAAILVLAAAVFGVAALQIITLQGLTTMADQVQELNDKIDTLTATVTDEIAEVKALLEKPTPDLSGALAKLDALNAAVESISGDVAPEPTA